MPTSTSCKDAADGRSHVTATKIAIMGVGKIARDQHIPTIAASDRFELVAAVTRHEPPESVPGFSASSCLCPAFRISG